MHKSVLNSVHVLCPKQGNKIEVLSHTGSATHLYPNVGQVPTPRGTEPNLFKTTSTFSGWQLYILQTSMALMGRSLQTQLGL